MNPTLRDALRRFERFNAELSPMDQLYKMKCDWLTSIAKRRAIEPVGRKVGDNYWLPDVFPMEEWRAIRMAQTDGTF